MNGIRCWHYLYTDILRQPHLQLQAVPVPKEFTDSLKTTYYDIAESQQIELTEVHLNRISFIKMALFEN